MSLINGLLILLMTLSIITGLYFYNPKVPMIGGIIFSNSVEDEWNKLNPNKNQVVVLGTSLLRQNFWLENRNLTDTIQFLMFNKSAEKRYKNTFVISTE